MKKLTMIAFLSAAVLYGGSTQKETHSIAKSFCGGKYEILATSVEESVLPGNFFVKCKEDPGDFSAVVRTGVLYTIHRDRRKPKQVRKIEYLQTNSDTWQAFHALWDEIEARHRFEGWTLQEIIKRGGKETPL